MIGAGRKPRSPVRGGRRDAGLRGFSLVELMVAIAVGLMVVGALLSAYYATTVSHRQGQALTQMSDDAHAALSLLRVNLVQVGYGRPTGVDAATGKFAKSYPGTGAGTPGLVGCDSAFVDPGQPISSLTCSGAGRDAVAVAYEVDGDNDLVSAAGVPLDCLGNGLAPTGPYYLDYNVFYLDKPAGATHTALFCKGAGAAAAQTLVENIEDLQIQYGVAADVAPVGQPGQAAYYATATAIRASGITSFDAVVSVRLCVVVASANAVMERVAGAWPSYRDCSGAARVPADGRMYRAFMSTVVLQNRLGVL